jgi:hypothetical protein
MNNEETFLVVESWLVPGTFAQFKQFRVKAIDSLLRLGAEYAVTVQPQGQAPAVLAALRAADA